MTEERRSSWSARGATGRGVHEPFDSGDLVVYCRSRSDLIYGRPRVRRSLSARSAAFECGACVCARPVRRLYLCSDVTSLVWSSGRAAPVMGMRSGTAFAISMRVHRDLIDETAAPRVLRRIASSKGVESEITSSSRCCASRRHHGLPLFGADSMGRQLLECLARESPRLVRPQGENWAVRWQRQLLAHPNVLDVGHARHELRRD